MRNRRSLLPILLLALWAPMAVAQPPAENKPDAFTYDPMNPVQTIGGGATEVMLEEVAKRM